MLRTCTMTLGLCCLAAIGLKEPDSLKAGSATGTAADGALAVPVGRRLVCAASSFSLAAEYSPAGARAGEHDGDTASSCRITGQHSPSPGAATWVDPALAGPEGLEGAALPKLPGCCLARSTAGASSGSSKLRALGLAALGR